MKSLMLTTAACLIMATSAFADGRMADFLDYSVADSDFLASEFIGMRVYSSENDVDPAANLAPDAQAEWDDIGEINELVISNDGTVRAVIVGVGGFLGIGEKDVAMEMEQIHVMREADDADGVFLVIKSSSAALEAAPGFSGRMKTADMDAETGSKRTMLTPPEIKRDGYARTERSELTAEMLTGVRVYGVGDEDVGEIRALLLDDKGTVDRAIIDVGGFLGIGEKPVAVSFDELTILRKDGGDDVQVFIDASQDALEAQPTYKN